MNNGLVNDICETMDELSKVFSSFKNEQIDMIPFEGSWTAGQVAEHIIKSISNMPEFFTQNTAPTTGRAFDANIEMLRKIFLDFSTKFQSPEFILPSSAHHDKAAILHSVDTFKMQMVTAAETLDLTVTCKSFELPGLGFLTRIEWLNFFVVHIQRHTQQLKNIYSVLNA